MAKAAALIASALCVLALAGFAQSHQAEDFIVQGNVYCDTCRVLFQTRVSQNLFGAAVELKCKARETGIVTYTVGGSTGADGTYSLRVSGDHEDDICEVSVVSSNNPDCSEMVADISSVRVTLTGNSGIQTPFRYANPIGFVMKAALPACLEVLDDLGFVPITV